MRAVCALDKKDKAKGERGGSRVKRNLSSIFERQVGRGCMMKVKMRSRSHEQ